MLPLHVSERIRRIQGATSPIFQYITESRWSKRRYEPGISDFLLGNPHEMPLEGFAEALQRQVKPQDEDWYAYKMSEPESQQIVAEVLQKRHGMSFEPDDIFMTNGAFAAIAVALGVITEPGDEIIYISPPWFFYEAMILSYYGTPVAVKCNPETFDLDIDAIAAAITPKTRGIIINSPNNPTGKIYSAATLEALAEVLSAASQRNGHSIALLSDESYNHIVYDGTACPTPASFYPNTFIMYTYGKTLLTPGQRIGYIALPPSMPDREQVRMGVTVSQFVTAYAFPNALLQHSLRDLEKLSIDIERLQAKRDRLVVALKQRGYELQTPEGTFYLLVRSPIPDDKVFTEMLAEHDIFCLPGSMFEMPGFFRISLTAADDMIERALPGFAESIRKTQQVVKQAV